MVKPASDRNGWVLTDLLGRPMGVIRTTDRTDFLIEPDGNAKATMNGMRCGPFPSLDEALATIETHTRGVCRREPDVAQPPSEDAAETTETSTDMSENASPAPE
jgi:hypothetical protein